jgi:nucleotide-binding universal stress UspA family protein
MIPMIKKILFTTDLSENSKHAFTYAAVSAARHGARIVLLHVREELKTGIEQHVASLFGQERWRKMQEEQKMSARDAIIGKRKAFDVIHEALASYSMFTDKTDAQVTIEERDILVKEGDVIDVILSTAAEEQCDIIVLGTHKGLRGKKTISAVTKEILQRAKIPVLVIPPAEIKE